MKRVYLALLGLIFAGGASADKVSQEQASKWAHQFFHQQGGSRAVGASLEMVWNGLDGSARATGDPAFYVFNRTDKEGFVIVSGDDLAQPLLGFSFDKGFEMEHLPQHIRYWLMDRKTEIELLRKHPEWAPKQKTEWSRGHAEVGKVIKEYKTANWDQIEPYNQKCPMIDGKQAVTGCTATAFAIAMHARKWPDAGMGVLPSYSYELEGKKYSVQGKTLTQPYAWDKMPMQLNQLSDEEEIDAVATLMHDCGLMCKASYTSGETAGAPEIGVVSLREHMKYSTGVDYYLRQFDTTERWHARLREELNANGPVVYVGYTQDGGHAFVLDAYTDQHFYHVNWGWGGLCNGYYTLTVLHPEEQGTGGSIVDEPFYYYQGAVLGMKKATEGEVMRMYPDLNMLPYALNDARPEYADYNGYYLGLTPATRSIKPNEPFVIDRLSFANTSTYDIDLELGLAVCNSKGELKEIITEEPMQQKGFSAGLMNFYRSWQVTIKQNFGAGDRLVAIYRPMGAKTWKVMEGGYKTQYYIPLGNGEEFATSTDELVLTGGLKYEGEALGLQADTKEIKKGKPFMVSTGSLCNTSIEQFTGKVAVALYGKDGVRKAIVSDREISQQAMPLDPDQTVEVKDLPCTIEQKIAEGDYLALCFSLASDGEYWQRVYPTAGMNARIALKASGDEEEDPLAKVTALTYNKAVKMLVLKTEKGVKASLNRADGTEVIQGVADEKGTLELKLAGLEKGNYTLVVKRGKETMNMALSF